MDDWYDEYVTEVNINDALMERIERIVSGVESGDLNFEEAIERLKEL